jgi:hypothetical protein
VAGVQEGLPEERKMKNHRANYRIVRKDRGQVIIEDIGPWDEHTSVTNDAENVVRELTAAGFIDDGRRLFYYDSEGRLDEILVKDGIFIGFAPGRARAGVLMPRRAS